MCHDSPEEKTLMAILDELQIARGIAVDQLRLTQSVLAQQIAQNQLLQTIVNNTNPKPFPTSFSVKQTK